MLSADVVLRTDFGEIVGFENHGGRTYLAQGQKPFGTVLRGYGNDTASGLEGAVVNNAIGTYLHGSLLPKNPALADHLILTALQRKYGPDMELEPLSDEGEQAAHSAAVAVARSLPSASRRSPSRNATDFPRCTTLPEPNIAPGPAAAMKFTFNSSVGANSFGPKVVANAGPTVSSSIAAKNPLETLPIGFVKSGVAKNSTRTSPLPGTASSTFHPRSFAAGGGGTSPRTAAQNGLSELLTNLLLASMGSEGRSPVPQVHRMCSSTERKR